MKVICVETVVTGGPVLDKAGNPTGVDTKVYNPPGAEIEMPDEEVPGLLKRGAIKLPGAPTT